MNTKVRTEVWILLALILVLLPSSIGLFVRYSSTTDFPSGQSMIPLPGTEELRQMAEKTAPNEGISIELTYDRGPELPTGIARVYTVQGNQKLLYKLVVFRHDIDCGVCRDITAVAVYSPAERKLVKVFLVEPWEVREKVIDTRRFLAQLEGHPLEVPIQLGVTIDGITGATKSSNGLVERLNEAALWIIEHEKKGGS